MRLDVLCGGAIGAPTGYAPTSEAKTERCGERTAMMPLRTRTRAQNRAARVATERHHNRQTRLATQRWRPLKPLSVVGWYWMQQVAQPREFGVHMLVHHGGEAL